MKQRLLLTFLLVPSALLAAPKGEITVRTLLAEMPDLNRLANLPQPAYTCRQASSYDRDAKSPTENWFTNGDYGKFIRVEHKQGRDEQVMADLTGPGAVTRIWSANPAGTLRIYVDGAELPELITNMEELLSGKHADFPPPFSHRLSYGANLYYPIPYKKGLKITATNPGSLYYHVNYRTYESGAKVQSFSMAQVKDAAKLAERVGNALDNPAVEESLGTMTITSDGTLEPGKLLSLRTPSGAGGVVQLKVSYATSGDEALALRRTLFEADFDGEACISAPLGDVYATAPGAAALNALPITVQKGVLTSRWVMPQSEQGRMFFTNYSDKPITLHVEVTWVPEPWTDKRMHFKAKWRHETLRTRPMRDWSYLSASATPGRWVGVAMFIANPVADWWGEGDEKVYVDGETFPSTFGTGTEDYFGYAWSSNQLFHHAYHNQIISDGPGNRGNSAVNRFQIIDDIPWKRDIRFDMEIWHWRDVTADFGATSYWYQRPGGKDTFPKLSAADLTFFPIPPPFRVSGAVEGETMKVLTLTSGKTEVQGLGEEWSDGKQVWWHDTKLGDKIAFEVPSARAGKLHLTGQFCVAADYGIVQLFWNGQRLGDPVDFYNDGVRIRRLDLGMVDAKLTNVFEAEIVGANPKAIKGYMFGIDYLLLGASPK